MKKVRVLVVIGTYPLMNTLQDILNRDNDLTIVADADDAYTARDMILEYKPDVMLISNRLIGMSGIEFIEKLMPQYPIPTVMLGPAELEERAYDAGVSDYIELDEMEQKYEDIIAVSDIAARLKITFNPQWDNICSVQPKLNNDKTAGKIIAMGASTGGTEAMAKVVKDLHKDIPGIVMVQHMPPGFTQMYAQRLDRECELSAKEAQSGDVVKPGQILLAPGDKQMRLVKMNGVYKVECRNGPKVSGHCPSVDVLFESVAKVAGKSAIGVLMTGMGRDGAAGLLKMRNAGALTIGQDEKTCVVYGMPKEAYNMGAVTWQVPLEQIANKIYYILDRKV